MNSRALLTALLFGSAIAGTRLLAQAPAVEPQCAPDAHDQAKATAVDGAASVDTARSPRCSG